MTKNRFGTVNNLAVNYYRGETLPISHIVSAQLGIRRYLYGGFFVTVMGIVGLTSGAGVGGVIFSILLLLWAVLLFWGFPRVLITASDGHSHDSKGWPWDRAEAKRFVIAINRELMNRA